MGYDSFQYSNAPICVFYLVDLSFTKSTIDLGTYSRLVILDLNQINEASTLWKVDSLHSLEKL